jgi:hypothetical protein
VPGPSQFRGPPVKNIRNVESRTGAAQRDIGRAASTRSRTPAQNVAATMRRLDCLSDRAGREFEA